MLQPEVPNRSLLAAAHCVEFACSEHPLGYLNRSLLAAAPRGGFACGGQCCLVSAVAACAVLVLPPDPGGFWSCCCLEAAVVPCAASLVCCVEAIVVGLLEVFVVRSGCRCCCCWPRCTALNVWSRIDQSYLLRQSSFGCVGMSWPLSRAPALHQQQRTACVRRYCVQLSRAVLCTACLELYC
jgi:hypothetical protein